MNDIYPELIMYGGWWQERQSPYFDVDNGIHLKKDRWNYRQIPSCVFLERYDGPPRSRAMGRRCSRYSITKAQEEGGGAMA